MSFTQNSDYDVNGTGTTIGESVASGRVVGGQQPTPGRHQDTANTRTNWTRELNKLVMKCFLMSEPERRGYRKRMHNLWKYQIGAFEVSEQKLAGQARAIRVNGWLSDLEIDELKREIRGEINDQQEEEIEDPQRAAEGSTECHTVLGEETFCKDEILEPARMDGCTGDKLDILEKLINKIEEEGENTGPPNLRWFDRKKVKAITRKVDEVVKYIPVNSLGELNRVLKAVGNVVAEELGVKKAKGKKNPKPWWKRRIEAQIKDLRRHVSWLEELISGKLKKDYVKKVLERKYNWKKRGPEVVVEELKQRIMAKAAKIKRYDGRIDQYNQNRMFLNNQKRLFEKLEGSVRDDSEKPPVEESLEFWKMIWEQDVIHNEDAEWIRNVKKDVCRVRKQENFAISMDMVTFQLRKVSNWKAPGPDGLQGFWVKNVFSVRQKLVQLLDRCLQEGSIPNWMTKGVTVLIQKDRSKGKEVSNFRPITCLPIIWKVFSGILAEEIYKHLAVENLLPVEQKGCRKMSRGTKDQLLIDKMVLRNCRRRQAGLAMCWIDYRKAFDLVPHSWILQCLDMFKVADNVKEVVFRSMNSWQTNLRAGNMNFGNIKIKRGIFQGDSLSPLLFVISMIPLSMVLRKQKVGYELGKKRVSINHLLFMDDLKLYAKNEKQLNTLINTVRIFSDDIKMEWGIKKCAVLVMKRGKYHACEGVALPGGDKIKEIDMDEGYKYLGVVEVDQILDKEMKSSLKKEYFRRIRTILKSKLNGGNTIMAINSRAVSLIRYGAGIIEWGKQELQEMDRKTRKLLTVYRSHHPQDDIDRLYVKRSQGGRGLISVEDCIKIEKESLNKYVLESHEDLIKEVDQENMIGEGINKQAAQEERLTRFKEKRLHAQFFNSTSSIRDEMTWNWLRRGELKKETEGIILAAQDQALRTRHIRKIIDKEDIAGTCRMCGEREETISHIITECSQLAQREYKIWRHDKVAQVIHWKACRKFNLAHADKWYDHQPEKVQENREAKILWDMKVQTDREIEHSKPDIVMIDKMNKSCTLIDVACPFDVRIENKEKEKLERYNDLRIELKRIWSCKNVVVVPVVIGALGTVSRNFKKYLDKLELDVNFDTLQKACLLGTARILRKVLDT